MLLTAYEKAEGTEVGRIETVVVEEKVLNKFNKNWLWLLFGAVMLIRALVSNTGSTPTRNYDDLTPQCTDQTAENILAPSKEHKTYERYRQIFQMTKDTKLCQYKEWKTTFSRFEALMKTRIQPVSLVRCDVFSPAYVEVPPELRQGNDRTTKLTRPPRDLLCIGDQGAITDIAIYFDTTAKKILPGQTQP